MARSKPVTIGKLHFATKTDAINYVKIILNGQPLKTPIRGPENNEVLRALVTMHPRAAEKIGPGIQHFTVEHALHGTRCFYITRVDGTRTDFSYLKCLRGRDESV